MENKDLKKTDAASSDNAGRLDKSKLASQNLDETTEVKPRPEEIPQNFKQ